MRTEVDAAAVAATANQEGRTVRVAGAGHSHQPLVVPDGGEDGGLIVDVSGLSGVIETDPATRRAWVWAGTPVHALGRPLLEAGLGLVNQGDIDRQLIGGAVATGTHGTGAGLGNLSSAVVGAEVALASGDLVRCGPDVEPELWRAVQLNLGAVGIVTRLQLQVRDAYRLRESGAVETLGWVLDRLDTLPTAHRHVEFFWYPTKDRAVVKMIDETDDEPVLPLGPEGSRVGWSFEVLPNHRTWPHTEIEYSVPAEQGPAAMAAIADLLHRDFPTMPWPVEYRYVAADDVWLSTAYNRPAVTISLHQAVADDEEPMFRAAEEIFRSFDGRPHWGKVNFLDGATLAAIHPRWDDWWTVRDQADPDGTFLNRYLTSIRP